MLRFPCVILIYLLMVTTQGISGGGRRYIRGSGVGVGMSGWAYTRSNNKISNFNVSCNMKLLQIIITPQQLMVSPNQSKSEIRRFHLHLHPHPRCRPAT